LGKLEVLLQKRNKDDSLRKSKKRRRKRKRGGGERDAIFTKFDRKPVWRELGFEKRMQFSKVFVGRCKNFKDRPEARVGRVNNSYSNRG
jgi:hypothetical protein